MALHKIKYRDLQGTVVVDGQEIYIRNPSAVLNVELCGMQAPGLLRVVLLWILLPVVHPILVLGTGRWMAVCQRSPS